MKKILLIAMVGFVSIGAQADITANLLSNAGFESGLTDWNTWWGPDLNMWAGGAGDAHSGAGAVSTATLNNNVLDSWGGVNQTVTGIVPGETYEASAWLRFGNAVYNQAYLQVEWQDAGGGFLLKDESPAMIQDDVAGDPIFWNWTYAQEVMTGLVAPAGAAQANIQVAFYADSAGALVTGGDTWMNIDDVEFGVVPEPATLGLAVIGGALLWFRKRV